MTLALRRALLAPLTSMRALRLWQRSNGRLSYDIAWRQARMLTAPDEMVYRLHGQYPGSVNLPKRSRQATKPLPAHKPPLNNERR